MKSLRLQLGADSLFFTQVLADLRRRLAKPISVLVAARKVDCTGDGADVRIEFAVAKGEAARAYSLQIPRAQRRIDQRPHRQGDFAQAKRRLQLAGVGQNLACAV